MVTRVLSLNVIPTLGDKTLKVSQHDTAVTVRCRVFDDAWQLNLTGATATVVGHTPSGSGFTETCSIDSGEVVFQLTGAMTAEAGKTELQVVITNGEEKISTNKVVMVVEKGAYNG